jgi:hypothetical protein
MCKKMIYLFCFVLVLGLAAGIANADLVGYWKFDEGSGNTAYDLSNYTNDGTINGGPKWVAGKIGAALEFDGSDDYVDCGNDPSLNINDRITVAAWVKTTSTAHGYFVSKGTAWDETGHYAIGQEYNVPMTFQFEIAGSGGTVELDSNVAVNDGQWHYIVGTYDDTVVRVYIDGVEENSSTGTNRLTDSAIGGLTIGQRGGNIISGTIDEVRIYNHALTEGEILGAMEGGEGYPYALGPNPADGVYYEDTWANLSWRPGDFTLSHDVYFGDNFDDVNNGAEGTFQGNQAEADFIVGFPGFPYPDGLVPGTTYYWRLMVPSLWIRMQTLAGREVSARNCTMCISVTILTMSTMPLEHSLWEMQPMIPARLNLLRLTTGGLMSLMLSTRIKARFGALLLRVPSQPWPRLMVLWMLSRPRFLPGRRVSMPLRMRSISAQIKMP